MALNGARLQTNDKIEQVLISCSRFMSPIRIQEYTLCVAVSGDHRGAAGNLLECPAYSLDAQTKARVVEDDYLVAMDIARGAERAEVIRDLCRQRKPPRMPCRRRRPTERSWTSTWGESSFLTDRRPPAAWRRGMTPRSFPHASYTRSDARNRSRRSRSLRPVRVRRVRSAIKILKAQLPLVFATARHVCLSKAAVGLFG